MGFVFTMIAITSIWVMAGDEAVTHLSTESISSSQNSNKQMQSSGHHPFPSQKKDFIQDFDRNKDGVVSREEFSGPVDIFNRLDINGDGVVTKEEAKRDGNMLFSGQGKKKDFIQDFDRNKDGVVSRKEFSGPVDIFNRLDINGDGVVTKEEAKRDGNMLFSGQDKKKGFIQDFDRNKDGVVSREEFSGPVDIFNRLDINRDGVVTKEEAKADRAVPMQEK